MSTFGSGGVWAAMVGGALLAVPIFGWTPLITMGVISAVYAVMLKDVNDCFYPNGMPRPRSRRRRR